MDVLYLAHRIPFPPDKGEKIRAFRQIEHLTGQHRVWCACFVDDAADERHVAPLRAHCHRVSAIRLRRDAALGRGALGLMRGRTLTETFYHDPRMTALLRSWSKGVAFDAAVAFSSSMAPYALAVPARRRVLDLCDVDSAKWMAYGAATAHPVGQLFRIEGRRLARKEQQWIGAFEATLVISEAEAALLADGRGAGRVHVLTNGVAPAELLAARPLAPVPGDRPPTVGFIGVMNYRPNVDGVCWFVESCWPVVRRSIPAAVFRIVGRNPARRVRRLADAAGVEVVGGVEHVGPELAGFDVNVAPLRIARGVQNKVLEAMAVGRPVVMTSNAAEGIAVRPGTDAIVVDDPEAIASAVVRLLRDPAARGSFGRAGRRFVERHHRWPVILRDFELVVTGQRECVAERGERPAMAQEGRLLTAYRGSRHPAGAAHGADAIV